MALQTGTEGLFDPLTNSDINLQNEDEGATLDEAQSINGSGGVGDFHSYNERKEHTANYEVAINDTVNAADVEIDIGSVSTGGVFITGATLTQGNTAYPRIDVNGVLHANGDYSEDTVYTASFAGLYFGVHDYQSCLTDATESDLQECTVTVSALTQMDCADSDGNHKESKIEAVRLEITGTLLNDGTPPTIASGFEGRVWQSNENQGYGLYNFRAYKLVSCEAPAA